MIMLVVLYEWLSSVDDGHAQALSYGVKLEGVPMATGIIAFAFVCHDSSFLLLNTLKEPTVGRWSTLTKSGCAAAMLICACFAVPGYLTFGDAVRANILNDYDR